jgi:hypothetical protein
MERVEGTFRMTASLRAICERGLNWVGCSSVARDAERPTIQVEGSFHAVTGFVRF